MCPPNMAGTRAFFYFSIFVRLISRCKRHSILGVRCTSSGRNGWSSVLVSIHPQGLMPSPYLCHSIARRHYCAWREHCHQPLLAWLPENDEEEFPFRFAKQVRGAILFLRTNIGTGGRSPTQRMGWEVWLWKKYKCFYISGWYPMQFRYLFLEFVCSFSVKGLCGIFMRDFFFSFPSTVFSCI